MPRKHNSFFREAANDPNFHDIRAKILLDAAQHLDRFTKENFAFEPKTVGLEEAATELRRMASNARRTHKKLQDERNIQARGSAAKAKAFGFPER